MFAKNIFRESAIYLSFFRRFNSILASDFFVMPLQRLAVGFLSLHPPSQEGPDARGGEQRIAWVG